MNEPMQILGWIIIIGVITSFLFIWGSKVIREWYAQEKKWRMYIKNSEPLDLEVSKDCDLIKEINKNRKK